MLKYTEERRCRIVKVAKCKKSERTEVLETAA
jgi:hypothetical protein